VKRKRGGLNPGIARTDGNAGKKATRNMRLILYHKLQAGSRTGCGKISETATSATMPRVSAKTLTIAREMTVLSR
jgi:hypothetical protein